MGRCIYRAEYGSIIELAAIAERHLDDYGRRFTMDWHGASSWSEVKTLARDGWAAEAAEALRIAESAVETVQRNHNLPSFRPVWDVAGSQVDVGRYLACEPENMIDYEPVETPRSGRVITLCVSGSISGAVSIDAIKRRGHTIAALAVALNTIGYALELWVDHTVSGPKGNDYAQVRVCVKGLNDVLDVARIMFACAHPAELRAIAHPARHAMPKKVQSATGMPSVYGYPMNPTEDMPEGTIYLPCVESDDDVPDADKELVRYLTELGIVQ